MEDQVLHLTKRGINATFLGSAQTDASVYSNMRTGASHYLDLHTLALMIVGIVGRYHIVYMTPEKFVGSFVQQYLPLLTTTKGIGLVAIDEAHCLRYDII